jgi:hypothetical protein
VIGGEHVRSVTVSGEGKPQISPLRCAPVEMTKGRAVMTRSSGLEKETADLSTTLWKAA